MKIILIVLLLIVRVNASFPQSDIDPIFDLTLSYRGMTRNDITIPINFDKDKSPTNDSKLLLPLVRDMMEEPMKSFGFMDEISGIGDLDLLKILEKLYQLKAPGYQFPNSFTFNVSANTYESLGGTLVKSARDMRKLSEKLSGEFSKDERLFLQNNLMSVIGESENEDNNNSDIFRFNKARDSSIEVSKKTMDILNKGKVISGTSDRAYDAEYCYLLYGYLKDRMKSLETDDEDEINNEHVQGTILYYYDNGGIRIAIGGKGKNIYTGHFDFIIDTGGDDVYNMGKETKDIFKNNFSCIIDLSGNDYYTADGNFTLAGSVFSSGFIFDKEGDDTYKGKSVSLGSAICGLGILYDENGNDTYQANQFSIGAASFGAGLLVDRNGNDVYMANSYSQGFGMTEGIGAIVDNKGNDSYLIDARSLDIGRYEDHYISMCQGYGLGLRPYYAGGIGLIIEGGGNDFYATDIFGQGGAYWYSLGCIVDKSGHDKYNSYQYAQGAGIHLAVGLLKDYDGWDFYTSDGVSQGCGHDYGFGLLYDVKGNDNYSAYSLSQGAGNANGIGILMDESGRDGYLNKEPGNTRGYGNSRREYGSIGIFLDASGEDFYSVDGMDSVISNSSMWGAMNDYYLQDLPEQASGNNFKIPLDSGRQYTTDEYFIMAKTIEPRFSKWQEYGFRKLAEDSLNTCEYILKYLGTEDHRAGLVLRNLAFRIGYSMGNFFKEKLQLYNRSAGAAPIFNQNEVSFICYLFGETGNPAGKEELLSLTYNDNIRIKSSAVNALGKIKVDSNETAFINDAALRLADLAESRLPYKLFNKDIAFAFNNYKIEKNIPVLIQLMRSDYFGVRFLAAGDLRAFGAAYSTYISDQLISEASGDKVFLVSFLTSILSLPEDSYESIISRLLDAAPGDELTELCIIDAMKQKLRLSGDKSFRNRLNSAIDSIQSKNILKVIN